MRYKEYVATQQGCDFDPRGNAGQWQHSTCIGRPCWDVVLLKGSTGASSATILNIEGAAEGVSLMQRGYWSGGGLALPLLKHQRYRYRREHSLVDACDRLRRSDEAAK